MLKKDRRLLGSGRWHLVGLKVLWDKIVGDGQEQIGTGLEMVEALWSLEEEQSVSQIIWIKSITAIFLSNQPYLQESRRDVLDVVLSTVPFLSLIKSATGNNRKILGDKMTLPSVNLQGVDTGHNHVGVRSANQVRSGQSPLRSISSLHHTCQARDIS